MTDSGTSAASDAGWSRRRWLTAFCGLAAVTATARLAYPHAVRGANLPPLALPNGLHPLLVQRLKGFHARYDAVFAAQGSVGLKAAVAADVMRLRGQDLWLDALLNWIRLGGWAQVAETSINVAEVGGADVRRAAAAALASGVPPAVTAAVHGSRIIALHRAETDPLARNYWTEVRRQLGI